MARVYNFSSGPAALPEPVLAQVADELLEWRDAGCSVMEMSHRGAAFTSIIEAAEADLRALLAVPDHYKVLFLQGGATQQFAQIPMNLLAGGRADYFVTGAWSRKAVREAQQIAAAIGGDVRLAASTEADGFRRFLRPKEIRIDPRAAYAHVCTNETIHGVECSDVAPFLTAGVPLVADMSSHILSRRIDVSDYGMIYAGAQKNIGPSGLVIVIVREDLLDRAWPGTPSVMSYRSMADNGSMLNTPPTFAIYVSGLVFRWLRDQGGLEAIEQVNRAKAERLYHFIDTSGFYINEVEVSARSLMNIPFRLKDESLNAAFLAGADEAGLAQLKGHKSVGGMRASIYNAMPLAGVEALVDYMGAFARQHA